MTFSFLSLSEIFELFSNDHNCSGCLTESFSVNGFAKKCINKCKLAEYTGYHILWLSPNDTFFACFISFQREKRELDIIWDHIYNMIV